MTLPAGWHKAAAQVYTSQQSGAVARRYCSVSGNQLDEAQMCCCSSSSSVAHGEDLHPPSFRPTLLAVYYHFDHLHRAVPAASTARRRVPQLDSAGLVLAAEPAGSVVDATLGALADAPQGGPAQVGQEVGRGGCGASVFSLFDSQICLGGQRPGGWNPVSRGHCHVRFHFGIYHDSVSRKT